MGLKFIPFVEKLLKLSKMANLYISLFDFQTRWKTHTDIQISFSKKKKNEKWINWHFCKLNLPC